MSARKTAIRVTNSAEIAEREGITNLAADALAAEDRADAAADRAEMARGLHWATNREREVAAARQLLETARKAARLEMRGKDFDAEDRADVAAQIVAEIMAHDERSWRGDAWSWRLQEAGMAKLSLSRMCGMARNYRRSIEAARRRDAVEANAHGARQRQTSDAWRDPAELTEDRDQLAKNAPLVARASLKAAAQAASALCERLGIEVTEDSPAWSVLYQWARGTEGPVCAAERGVTAETWRQRTSRGAKHLRGFWSAEDLARMLTLGARTVTRPTGATLADGTAETETLLLMVVADDSREASHQLPADIAECWQREHQTTPTEAEITRRKLDRSERVHWTKQRARREDHADHVGDSLTAIAREYGKRQTRERPVLPADQRRQLATSREQRKAA